MICKDLSAIANVNCYKQSLSFNVINNSHWANKTCGYHVIKKIERYI